MVFEEKLTGNEDGREVNPQAATLSLINYRDEEVPPWVARRGFASCDNTPPVQAGPGPVRIASPGPIVLTTTWP